MRIDIYGETVSGVKIDAATRCAHYNSDLDIIAIKFKCCGEWFPCFECHREVAGHEPAVWPVSERDAPAIFCGACGNVLTINEYFECGSVCPQCASSFNPGCANHYHLYFA